MPPGSAPDRDTPLSRLPGEKRREFVLNSASTRIICGSTRAARTRIFVCPHHHARGHTCRSMRTSIMVRSTRQMIVLHSSTMSMSDNAMYLHTAVTRFLAVCACREGHPCIRECICAYTRKRGAQRFACVVRAAHTGNAYAYRPPHTASSPCPPRRQPTCARPPCSHRSAAVRAYGYACDRMRECISHHARTCSARSFASTDSGTRLSPTSASSSRRF